MSWRNEIPEETTLDECRFDGVFNENPYSWLEPYWEANLQHPDTGWYLDFYWNEDRDGNLSISVYTVAEQYNLPEDADMFSFEELQIACDTHHDMMLFVKRIEGFYETFGQLKETLMNEGFRYYDL